MEQKINCTVTSCKYNKQDKICGLKEIIVTENTDESMCGSYEYHE